MRGSTPADREIKEHAMNIFVAGASGAIGKPLIRELLRRGHRVTGMSRGGSAAQSLAELGATMVAVDAFNEAAVRSALQEAAADVVINQLTALPRDPSQISSAIPGDRKLRLEGGGNLLRAARAIGVPRYLQQLSGFFLKARDRLADESDGLAVDASPGVASSATMYAELESRLRDTGAMECVGLRYGFFYGPNTWYHPDGAVADQVRRGEYPILGSGQGVWSWIHIEDAAIATADALAGPPGFYNIVDDDPSPLARWLPAFARFIGALPPRQIPEDGANADALYYANRLSGASNQKAKGALGFAPRRLEWLEASTVS
jgi:nucleoside-diphosphate-sugar epimerase